jgi:hypothetical protein
LNALTIFIDDGDMHILITKYRSVVIAVFEMLEKLGLDSEAMRGLDWKKAILDAVRQSGKAVVGKVFKGDVDRKQLSRSGQHFRGMKDTCVIILSLHELFACGLGSFLNRTLNLRSGRSKGPVIVFDSGGAVAFISTGLDFVWS